MLDLPALSSQIQELETSADFWNTARIWLMGITAFIAVLSVIASHLANTRSRQLADARKVETQHKEDQRQKESEEARKEIEAIKTKNLTLSLELEDVQKARLELQRRLADRFLTSAQERIISDAIRPHAGQKISVTSVASDEAKVYAGQLIQILRESKWKVELYDEQFLSPPPFGVLLRISPQANTAVQSLVSAFEKAGVKPILIKDPSRSSDFVQLIVGAKPPP